jgi:uncharacterized circularly permuted ATP-grasp superfamily protein/uncharacterized alpha-E superfamily protein
MAESMSTPPPSRDAVGEYQAPASVFDELKDSRGQLRGPWSELAPSLLAADRESVRDRREVARQLLQEHGVTYNVHADGRNDERPWKLDILPLLLEGGEWNKLRTGLEQRTRLLDLLLQDLYGPQNFVRDGLMPPAVVHANPGFLRPCHGIAPAGGHHLGMHAVDLTRAPNGEWWVLADRTQAPSGVGYALENRNIISRVLPDELRNSHVQALAPFFAGMKAGLRSLASWTDTPTIVLLTPGPWAETYFEHAYLARHLGFPLVEGGDLSVRNRQVFLRTIEGLQRVDVIVRRLDDTFCDPLELRANSYLGVSGLVEAARSGTVAISNSLGAGAVEAPALLAFLPALARRVLDETLLIPNAATWWCGQEKERTYTLQNLHKLVIKSAFLGADGHPFFGEGMSAAALEQLAGRIRERPYDFVGQQRVALSTVPVWKQDRLFPHPLILRCFVCATPEGFRVMPGGLTRVSGTPESPVVTSRHGGGSKDTWIISSNGSSIQVSDPSHEDERHPHIRGAPSSRFAENMFWLGRTTERLEDNARLLRTALSRLAGEGSADEEKELLAVKSAMVELQRLPAYFKGRVTRAHLLAALQDLIFDDSVAGSEIQLVERIRMQAASLRDRLSGDTWRILNLLQSEFKEAPQHGPAATHLRTLHKLVFHLAAFNGMEMENMTRGTSWRFLELGRRIERACNLLDMIRAVVAVDPTGSNSMIPLLEYSDSIMTYRRRHYARPTLSTTLDLLLHEPTNPRALSFQIHAICEHLQHLPGSAEHQPEMLHYVRLAAALESPDLRQTEGGIPFLREVDSIGSMLRTLSDILTERFFSHVMPRVS